jgi:hypothetical protein
MINLVDADGSGQVEFNEFLDIMKATSGETLQTKEIADFFKKLCTGPFSTSNMSFSIYSMQQRRKFLLEGLRSSDLEKKKKGQKILTNMKA